MYIYIYIVSVYVDGYVDDADSCIAFDILPIKHSLNSLFTQTAH